MLLLFLITCFSLIIFSQSSPTLKRLALSTTEMKLLFLWFWNYLSFSPIAKYTRNTSLCVDFSYFSSRIPIEKKNCTPRVESLEENSEMSLLDLPDLVIESILEKLSPDGLCRVASVCTTMRDKCLSNHLWGNHVKNKWGRIIGPAAYKKWRGHIDSRKGPIFSDQGKKNGLKGYYLIDLWPFDLIRSSLSSIFKKSNFPPADSIMSCYLALESGKFWFPAQVYNRENGHAGFMLSCYDAEVSYDRRTDTFYARYLAHGTIPSAIETGVTWDRLRAPPVETCPHDLHISDCLNELRPGDQIEIQWRRNNDFPYGWWYGVVGHLETCDGNASYCRCHESDTLVLEFNQYTHDSRWRRTNVSRKDHKEKGNEIDGFYAGIRKLYDDDEISTWRKLWPAEVFV